MESRLPASALEAINQHFEKLDAPAADAAPETPLPGESAEVEQPDALAPEAEAAPSTATTGEAKPNATVPPPASWQPDEVARQAARNLGLPDEVVRDFRSEAEFNRALHIALAMKQSAAPQAAPSPTAPKPPSAIDKILADEMADPDVKAALKELVDRDAAKQQVIEQLSQGTAQQQQAAQQRHFAAVIQSFDKAVDELADDFLGSDRAKASEEHLQRREKLFDVFSKLANQGLVTEINRDAVASAMAIAHPQQFQEQLRRQIASAARSQASQRLTAGRTAATPRTPPVHDPANDPEVKGWFEKAQRGELVKQE